MTRVSWALALGFSLGLGGSIAFGASQGISTPIPTNATISESVGNFTFIDAGTIGVDHIVPSTHTGMSIDPGSGFGLTNPQHYWGESGYTEVWLGGMGIPTNKALCLDSATCAVDIYYDGSKTIVNGIVAFQAGASVPTGQRLGLEGNVKGFYSDGVSFQCERPLVVAGDVTISTGNLTLASGQITASANMWAKGNAGFYIGSGANTLIEAGDGGQLTGGGSRCTFGQSTLSSSAVTVTFKTAFGVAPRCTCSHIAAVPLSCGLTATTSTTQAAFAVATGSGAIDWICCGGN